MRIGPVQARLRWRRLLKRLGRLRPMAASTVVERAPDPSIGLPPSWKADGDQVTICVRHFDGTSMPRKIAARKSTIHGNGVFALAPIARGERIIEYKGKRRTHADVDAGDSGDVDSGHTFLFTLNDDYVIDANFSGNSARWINHSCKPNCEAVLDENEKDPKKSRVFIEARRAIKPGEELTYDYGITLDEPHTARLKKIWACRCGAKNCTGTMLKPKR
jgi:SET domain-containing protein